MLWWVAGHREIAEVAQIRAQVQAVDMYEVEVTLGDQTADSVAVLARFIDVPSVDPPGEHTQQMLPEIGTAGAILRQREELELYE